MNFGNRLESLFVLAALAVGLTACGDAMNDSGGGQGGADGGDRKIVVPGKSDDYYSNVAEEYELNGTIDVAMTDEEYADESDRNKAVSSRLTAVGLYLTTYLTAKIEGVDSDGSGEIESDERMFENMDYGGFKAMVRNHSLETEDVSRDRDDTYEVDYTIDVAGPQDFPQALLDNGGQRTDDGIQFSFQMPAGATSDPQSVDRGEIRDFDPDSYDGELETVELTVDPLPKIRNAYPYYESFFQDGVYDITLLYGHDYTDARHDLQDAEEAFDKLRRMGFKAPVDSFDALDDDSGAFVRTIKSPGRSTPDTVTVQVRIYHSDMFKGEREKQRRTALQRLRESDVFFYNGHAGPYYGLYLDGDYEAQISHRELADVELSDKNQLFVAQGCQTYSQYADMLYANPAKSESNLDVITTVNYSYGRGTLTLFENLISTDDQTHDPTPFYEIVENLNEDWVNSTRDVFYGVMGIDKNPKVHPYGDVQAIGDSCQSAGDCGVGAAGNVCANGTCTVRALAKGSCPDGTKFGYLTRGDRVEFGVCYGDYASETGGSSSSYDVQCKTDVNCGDMSSCEEAQAFLSGCEGDPHYLDRDNDGTACESLCD